MNKATSIALHNAMITEYNIDTDTDKDKTIEPDGYPEDWKPCTLVTQNLEDANSFLNKYSVNHKILDNFDPHGFWIGVNINKVKIKWRSNPNQWTDKDSNVYSIFFKKDYRLLTGKKWKLIIIPTSEPDFAICIAEHANQSDDQKQQFTKTSLAINNIIEDISTDYVKDEETEALLIPHLKKTITRSFLPIKAEQAAKDAGLDMTCHECIDHYRVTLDSHGLYINRLTRNKIRSIEDPGPESLIAKANPDYIWVKNIRTGDIVFSLDLKER